MALKSLPWLLLVIPLLPFSAISGDSFNDDVLGLIVFKASLNDPLSKLTSWTDSDDDPCNWVGIKCDPDTNRVTGLTLDGFSLSGEISRGLLRLQFLQRLSLSENNFTGSISPDFASLWSLNRLDLSGNRLSGSIPAELFQQCGSLESVSFAGNRISGKLPATFSSCMSLVSVDFSSNQLSGELPAKIWSLTGLQSLDLSNNLFHGEIPSGIGSMYTLKVLNFGKNSFTGALPEDIGECSQLQSVDFGDNSFSGYLPNSISQLESLQSLDLSVNKFSGSIPSSLGNLSSLKSLNLSSNGFTGFLPETLESCSTLVSIDASKNLLSGDLPNWIFTMGLHRISLSSNKFTGMVNFPSTNSADSSFQTLEVLDLSSNMLSGVLPSQLGAFKNLLVLNISSNSLSGSIPPSIGKLGLVQIVDLSKNKLNGSIPLEIGEASSLRKLSLQRNLLTGSIPIQLGNCSALNTLILAQNNLTGDIPKDLTNLANLQSFNISYNNFTGELPESGFFDTIPLSSVSDNPALCGSLVRQACPSVHPKPIVLNPNPPSNDPPQGNLRSKKLVLSISSLVAIGAAAFIFLGVVVITILNIRSRSASAPFAFSTRDDELSHSAESETEHGKLVMFSGEADFGPGAQAVLSKDHEIGRGAFGVVYRAILGDGKSVAIKKLGIANLVKSQDEFEREARKIGKADHPNLVSLEGYYWTPALQLLINEHVSGGNLFNKLHQDPRNCLLSWDARYRIILGIAKGLAYLHKIKMPHYNVKSTNVLLDRSNEPKIGDFGLAGLLPVLGQTGFGYMAPEVACRTAKITEKCDIYAFGILVLEIVSGRRPVEYMEDDVRVLCDVVREAMDQGKAEECVDSRLFGEFKADEVFPAIKLGLICASRVPSNRPDMDEVVSILELIGCSSGDARVRFDRV